MFLEILWKEFGKRMREDPFKKAFARWNISSKHTEIIYNLNCEDLLLKSGLVLSHLFHHLPKSIFANPPFTVRVPLKRYFGSDKTTQQYVNESMTLFFFLRQHLPTGTMSAEGMYFVYRQDQSWLQIVFKQIAGAIKKRNFENKITTNKRKITLFYRTKPHH